MEVLTFRQQLEAYAKAQVLVMGHGAAFANIMFMAPVKAAASVLHTLMSQRKHMQPAAFNNDLHIPFIIATLLQFRWRFTVRSHDHLVLSVCCFPSGCLFVEFPVLSPKTGR